MFYEKFDEQCKRLSRLEEKVASLTELIRREFDDDRKQPTRKQPAPAPAPTPAPAPAREQERQAHPCEPIIEYGTPAETEAAEDCETPAASFRAPERQASILTTMHAVTSPMGYEEQVPFDDDIEALLDTCIHQSQHLFPSS